MCLWPITFQRNVANTCMEKLACHDNAQSPVVLWVRMTGCQTEFSTAGLESIYH